MRARCQMSTTIFRMQRKRITQHPTSVRNESNEWQRSAEEEF